MALVSGACYLGLLLAEYELQRSSAWMIDGAQEAMPIGLNNRKYFITAIALILCATCIDFVAMRIVSRATYLLAKSITDTSAPETERVAARTESDRLGEMGRLFWIAGLSLAVLGAAAWYMAARCHEPVSHLLLFSLFVLWCLLKFVIA